MLTFRTTEYGGLQCTVVEDASAPPTAAAVFLHGFGATGEDLVPLAEELAARMPESSSSVRFVFPAAPLAPPEFRDFGGRAWWPLNMAALQNAMLKRDFRDLRRETPPQLPAARQLLMTLLDDLRAETGLAMNRIVLGGFSQGSMLATDVALRLDEAPAALVVWSGTLLCEDEWRALAPRRQGLPVIQSHGRQDPILPFEAAGWLRDMLTEAGADVEFHAFPGPHTIPPVAINATAKLLEMIAGA